VKGVPPRVTPAQVAASFATSSDGWLAPTVPGTWALFLGALGYWLPHGLNQGIGGAQAARRKRLNG
jgi:hypothetical protein